MDRSKVLAKAQKLLQKGQIKKAIEEYKVAVKADPNDAVTRIRLGDLYAKVGKKDEAIKEYLAVGDLLAETGFISKAIAVYKQILKLDESIMDVHQRLADLYHRQGLLAEAMHHYSILIRSLEKEGRKEEVLPLLEKLVESDPGNLALRMRWVKTHWEAGKREGAVRAMEKTLKDLLEEGNLEGLELFCKRLLENGIVERAVYRGLIEVYSRRGDREELLKAYRDLLHFLRESGAGREEIEEVSKEISALSGEGVEAEEGAEEAIEEVDIVGLAGEEDPETHFNAGIAYMEMGLFEKALEEFEESSKDPSFTFESYSRMALCLSSLGRFEEACSYMEKALELPGRSRDEYLGLLYDLALALEGAGRVDKALELFKRIYTEDKGFREVEKKVEELSQATP